MPVGLGARSATLEGPREGTTRLARRPGEKCADLARGAGPRWGPARHSPFSSISMNTNSKEFALRTSCSTPASR
jgi:hypothetical protein